LAIDIRITSTHVIHQPDTPSDRKRAFARRMKIEKEREKSNKRRRDTAKSEVSDRLK
jgi:hypothetical protein